MKKDTTHIADFDHEDLLDLANDYLSGAASEPESRRLETILAGSEQARAAYVRLAVIHAQLSTTRAAAIGPQPSLPGIRPHHTRGRRLGGAVVLAVAAAVAVAFLLVPTGDPLAVYDQRQLPLATVAVLEDIDATASEPSGSGPAALTPTTLRPDRPTAVTSTSGAAVAVPEAAVFGLASGGGGVLYDGSVEARLLKPEASFSVTAANLRIVDKGTAFRVDRHDDDHIVVTVLDGEVEVQSRVRLPVCYWTFDDAAEAPPGKDASARDVGRETTDVVAGLRGTFRGGARPIAGLVGRGAARFDNQGGSAVTIAGGTGDTVGTGLLAAAEGISIEAVFVSHWSGRHRDYDEIYRKEDGNCRVLLSFQNDGNDHAGFRTPPVQPGPCLSFGLHLAGRGYEELDMPLDGREGRPTVAELTDGRPHHVVATYDSFTGRKAIFIDGRPRFAHDYPVGTMILSGGPVAAAIGNLGDHEPFTGTIDELAVYDFAVTPQEVEQHHAHILAGRSYFGSEPPAAGGSRWQPVTRLTTGETRAFNQHTGLPVTLP
jgi:hypothetical protein